MSNAGGKLCCSVQGSVQNCAEREELWQCFGALGWSQVGLVGPCSVPVGFGVRTKRFVRWAVHRNASKDKRHLEPNLAEP